MRLETDIKLTLVDLEGRPLVAPDSAEAKKPEFHFLQFEAIVDRSKDQEANWVTNLLRDMVNMGTKFEEWTLVDFDN